MQSQVFEAEVNSRAPYKKSFIAMTELIKSIILASRWNYNRNCFFYSSIIKHVHIF